MTLAQRLQEYAYLHSVAKAHDEQAKAIRASLDVREQSLIDAMVEEGVTSIKVIIPIVEVKAVDTTNTRKYNIAPGEKTYPKILLPEFPEDTPSEVIEATKKTIREKCVEYMSKSKMFKHLVKKDFNQNSLSSYLKELRENEQEIPAGLKKFIDYNPVAVLNIRKSG
jgi:hypothetical protein